MNIVPYTHQYKRDFKALNEAWILKHWQLEPSDKKTLDHPDENIIERGGYIAIAESQGEAVGTCALIKIDDTTYELAKMAVADSAQGKGLGFLLGRHIIQKARELGAKRVYLETNAILTPAISLYRKLGFKDMQGQPSPYERCNVQMDLVIESGE